MDMAGDKPCFVSRGDARDQSRCCHSSLGACLIQLDKLEPYLQTTVRCRVVGREFGCSEMLWWPLSKT